MRVERVTDDTDAVLWQLHDKSTDLELPNRFLRHLHHRSMSPNTIVAHARDLALFMRFLSERQSDVLAVGPAAVADFLAYLVRLPVSAPGKRQRLTPVTNRADGAGRRRAPTSINRTLAAVSSFFEFVITIEQFHADNPVRLVEDHAIARVPDRHQPFMGRASRQRPVRRAMRVRTVRTLPRPMADTDVEALVMALRRRRDRAAVLLMLDGGLRPGEVLGLRIPEDVEYGRRRVHVRHRDDHPRGARQKSRTDRVVDLHDPRTLAAVSDYVMTERPRDIGSPYLFLVGGRGNRRGEPLSYQALWRAFSRCCDRLGIRTPWVTPHALRHTHATQHVGQRHA